MKRFWTTTGIETDGDAFAIVLDGRRVRTPRGRTLRVPTEALAQAVAAEWDAVEGAVRPQAMPMTGMANAAIDIVADDPAAFAQSLARYGQSDLLCYRAEGPEALAAQQAAAWNPLLGWAESRFDCRFAITRGIVPVCQPEATLARVHEAFAARPPFSLAALSLLVTLSGSAVIALAVAEGAVSAEEGWAAAVIDESWQARTWGEDPEAAGQLEGRRRQFVEAARFLRLAEDIWEA